MRVVNGNKAVSAGSVEFSNGSPLVLIGGVNVLESRDLAFKVAKVMAEVTSKLGMKYVFKEASTRRTPRRSTPTGAPALTRGSGSSRM